MVAFLQVKKSGRNLPVATTLQYINWFILESVEGGKVELPNVNVPALRACRKVDLGALAAAALRERNQIAETPNREGVLFILQY